MVEPDPPGRLAGMLLIEEGHGHPVGDGIEEGDLEPFALARPLALVERRENGPMGVHAGRHVDQRDAHPARRLGPAGDGGEAAFRLDQKVVCLHVAIGPRFAVAADVATDQARIARAHLGAAYARARSRAGCQVLDEDVRPANHVAQDREIVGRLDVQLDRFLAPVEPDEIGALALGDGVVAAREVAARALDLDHPGARVGEPRRAKGRRHRRFERHDQQPVQRAWHQ